METAQRSQLLHSCPLRTQHSFRALPRPQKKQAGCASHPVRNRESSQGRLQWQLICASSPLDLAWGTSINIDAQSLAANLFASSIFPYAAFLYYLTKSKKTPGKALFGFYFLLVFVFATIPAGIYAKIKYGTILANVDWLHGSAESFLTITNLFIVFGVREGIRGAEREKLAQDAAAQGAPIEAQDTQPAQKQ